MAAMTTKMLKMMRKTLMIMKIMRVNSEGDHDPLKMTIVVVVIVTGRRHFVGGGGGGSSGENTVSMIHLFFFYIFRFT